MKYGTWTLGRIEALLNKLGEANALRLLTCSEASVTFEPTGKKAGIVATVAELAVWKTITIGTGVKGKDFFSVRECGVTVGDLARRFLQNLTFPVASVSYQIDLVLATPADLGLDQGGKFCNICSAAFDHGLGLCPAEAAPQLRAQYDDQPSGEWLMLPAKDLRDEYGHPCAFAVFRDKPFPGLWLDGTIGNPGHSWAPDIKFVFCRPRPNVV